MALDRPRIVAEAVALLDEGGLDGVTLRRLAQRLGVQAPTLYWHIRNKARLINELGEAILADQLASPTPAQDGQPWHDWLIGLAQRLRRAMLAHPDGARVVSAAHLSMTMAAVSELAMSTLVERGPPLHRARLTVLAVQHFTIGHVLAEQSPPPDKAAVDGFDQEAFARRHPTVVAAARKHSPGGTRP